MRNRVLLLVVFLSLWVRPLQAELIDKVIAVVNEQPITLYELDAAMARNLEMLRQAPGTAEQKEHFKNTKELALQGLIDEKLLEQEMEKRGIVVEEADTNKAIDNILKRNNMSEAQLKKEIQDKGQSWDAYVASVKEQMKRIKFMGQVIAPRVKVTDADLDEFFAKNPDKFSRFQSVDMAQIIIPLDASADDAQLAKAQSLAKSVQEKASRGADFEQLGKEYSVNAQTAVRDVYPVAQLAPQIIEVLGDLKPGQVSEPVRSNLGIHVIKLYERKTLAGEEYQVIREQIRERVYEVKIEEELQEYLDDLKSKSFIEVKAS